jgi:carboxyl-terminal processing protease
MTYIKNYRVYRLLALMLFFVFYTMPVALSLPALSLEKLEPTTAIEKTSIEIMKYLQFHHYKKLKIDNEFSKEFLKQYISELDKQRLYFLAEDIREFEDYQDKMDDALKKGNLQPAFHIFNRYRQRTVERLQDLVHQVETGLEKLDFSIQENMTINRSEAVWAIDETELNHLWRKRLKNSVLNFKLEKKPLKEIQKLLLKRYRNQLNHLQRANSMDAFQIYINTVARLHDPHTQYFPPRDYENFDIMMRLSLEGIGAVLHTQNEYVEIVRLVPAGPADKAKVIKPGDRIVGVAQGKNGKMVDVIGWRLDEVVDLIRGPKHTLVRLEIIPANALTENHKKEISIIRDTVKLEEQAAQKKIIDIKHGDKTFHIGILDIPTFYIDFKAYQAGDENYKSTTRDIQRLLKELKASQIDGIIIDLRDNGGGSLQEAAQLTGLFIVDGPIVQIRDNQDDVSILYDTDSSIAYKGPLLVLTNRHSASASEIFAGAIQDYHRGLIVGTRTFGKGTVQSLQPVHKGQLKLTRAKFYRASGQSTQHQGIIPDICLPPVYDAEKIGESALPNALPWDRIDAAKYQSYPDRLVDVSLLQLRHLERIKDNSGFYYLIENYKFLKKLREKKEVVLNETQRMQEHKKIDELRLNIENKRRKEKGLKPFQSIDAFKISETKTDSHKEGEDDPLLEESEKILADYITTLTQQTGASAHAFAPRH